MKIERNLKPNCSEWDQEVDVQPPTKEEIQELISIKEEAAKVKGWDQ